MNNENKDFFTNDVESNVSEEEIILAPPAELFDEAKEIAQNTVADEKYPFGLQYDANQKAFLLSMLQDVGAIVEYDGEEGRTLSTMMNMVQLVFVKKLDCIEKVVVNQPPRPTDLQINEEEIDGIKTAFSVNGEVDITEGVIPHVLRAVDIDGQEKKNTNAVQTQSRCIGDPSCGESQNSSCCSSHDCCHACSECSCSCCSSNRDMQSAKEISIGSTVYGCICCPGTEQWFKFTVPVSKSYTVYTTSEIDTVGTLYDCCGNQIGYNDDFALGMLDFRIVKCLNAGQTYYVKVRAFGLNTGSYQIRITDTILVNSINVSHRTIYLEVGKLYELPTRRGQYFGRDGAVRIPNFSANVVPTNATNQDMFWWEFSDGVIDITTVFYDNTRLYCNLLAKKVGTATLRVQDRRGVGATTVCTVVVKESAIVRRDGNYNKIVFNSSGKTWNCLNYDLVHEYNSLNQSDRLTMLGRLYNSMYQTVILGEDNSYYVDSLTPYSDDEMKLIYTIDPLGFPAYVQEYARYVYSTSLEQAIAFKDRIYKLLFNTTPKHYARRETDGSWYDATNDNVSIHERISESELLFGEHPLWDYITFKALFSAVLQLLSLPLSLAKLAGIEPTKSYKVCLKMLNFKFSIWKADVENDFEQYIEAVKTATENDSNTKTSGYNLDWAKDLFKLSESFGELAEALEERPNYHKEMLQFCANNDKYVISFEYNGGTIESASSIVSKLN